MAGNVVNTPARELLKLETRNLALETPWFRNEATYRLSFVNSYKFSDGPTGAALLENNEATAKSTSQDGGMAVNFG